MRTSKSRKILTNIIAMLLVLVCAFVTGCVPKTPVDPVKPPVDPPKPEKVAVKEVILELSKNTIRVGESVTVSVQIRPTNATDKTYAIKSSVETVAKVSEDNTTITALASGTVIITARSKSDPTKKAEASLVVLGADENGRYENLYEAEDGNIIPHPGSGMKIENKVDDRLTGTGVVGNLAKYDRIIWGLNASEADNEAILSFRLMGPSGWLGSWDSINYKFADWYTIKLNGVTIDTENILVEGTHLTADVADYYAVKDILIGNVALKKGLNVITFVVSNRYDQTSIHEPPYNGNLGCWGNIDSIKVLSSKTLTYVDGTVEVENPSPDINFNPIKMEAEASTTRIYESATNPDVVLTGKYAEFKAGMNIMFGVRTTTEIKARLELRVAAPYINTTTDMADVALKDMISLNLDGRTISVGGLTIKGNATKNSKENYTTVTTDWFKLAQGENILTIVAKKNTALEYLGGLDYASLNYCVGSAEAFKVSTPRPQTTVTLQAESDKTKLVGYEALGANATCVEFVNAKKVQEDIYNNKQETTKIIFGVESSLDTFATIKMNVATPFVNATTPMEDVDLGSIGDLWVNGKTISTPNTLKGNGATNKKDNFNEVEIDVQIELKAGKNRIVWEPFNYTDKTFGYFGALDYISITTIAEITPYKVNFWADRNTYFDDANNEPMWVTCETVSATTPNSTWIAVYKAEDPVQENSVGCLYYYYPTNAKWNTDKKEYFKKPVDILTQNPNKDRPLIGATTGGQYKIVYFETDGKNGTNGYDVVDVVYISVWDDPDVYGGRK